MPSWLLTGANESTESPDHTSTWPLGKATDATGMSGKGMTLPKSPIAAIPEFPGGGGAGGPGGGGPGGVGIVPLHSRNDVKGGDSTGTTVSVFTVLKKHAPLESSRIDALQPSKLEHAVAQASGLSVPPVEPMLAPGMSNPARGVSQLSPPLGGGGGGGLGLGSSSQMRAEVKAGASTGTTVLTSTVLRKQAPLEFSRTIALQPVSASHSDRQSAASAVPPTAARFSPGMSTPSMNVPHVAACASVRAAELTLNIVQDRMDIVSMLTCFLPVVEGTGAPMLASVTRLVKATGLQPRVSSTSK